MKKYLLITTIIFLSLGFFTQTLAADTNKPLERFQQTIDKLLRYGDNAQVSADKSLKAIDNVLKTTEKFYRKVAKDKNQESSPIIENLILESSTKSQIAKLKLKVVNEDIKEYKKTDKGFAGETNKLKKSMQNFVTSFNDFKATVVQLIIEVKKFSISSSQSPIPLPFGDGNISTTSALPSPTPKPTRIKDE